MQKFVERGGLKAGERILKAEIFRRLAGKVSGHGFGGGVGIAIGEGGRGHGCPREKVKSACVTLPKTSGKANAPLVRNGLDPVLFRMVPCLCGGGLAAGTRGRVLTFPLIWIKEFVSYVKNRAPARRRLS